MKGLTSQSPVCDHQSPSNSFLLGFVSAPYRPASIHIYSAGKPLFLIHSILSITVSVFVPPHIIYENGTFFGLPYFPISENFSLTNRRHVLCALVGPLSYGITTTDDVLNFSPGISLKFVSFPSFHSFFLQISLNDIDSHSELNQFEHHVHREYEIYLNLSGDVSFMVEDRIYPVSAGSVIITRPYEYHHCIYRSNERHRHYRILFSSDNNEKILDVFFNREAGQKNFLMIAPSKLDRFIYILEKLRCSELTIVSYYKYFFEFLEILDESKNTIVNNEIKLNSNLLLAIRYINDNISYQFSIDELAKAANTSISTLERNFCHFLGMTPSKYIRQRRLGIAIGYLNSGKSVTEACFDSGFSDCSKFISLFKRNFGMTPLKYKKKFSRQ